MQKNTIIICFWYTQIHRKRKLTGKGGTEKKFFSLRIERRSRNESKI